MIVCPVCEHVQAQGGECAVCGKVFPRGTARELPVERLPGLELTTLASAAMTTTAVMPAAPMEGLERTRMPSAPGFPVARLDALELHRAEPPPPTERVQGPVPGMPITCRYCRNVQNVQLQGQVCDGCGMRLTRYMGQPSPSSASAASAAAPGLEAPVVLHKCGVRTRAGERCSSCGASVPLPDER